MDRHHPQEIPAKSQAHIPQWVYLLVQSQPIVICKAYDHQQDQLSSFQELVFQHSHLSFPILLFQIMILGILSCTGMDYAHDPYPDPMIEFPLEFFYGELGQLPLSYAFCQLPKLHPTYHQHKESHLSNRFRIQTLQRNLSAR